jgi:hypothetical protein
MTDIPDTPYLDNPSAPDLYADFVGGWHRCSGNVKITLVAFRANHITTPGPVNRVVIGRLVMPLEQAEFMAKETLRFLDGLKAEAAAAMQGTATVQ